MTQVVYHFSFLSYSFLLLTLLCTCGLKQPHSMHTKQEQVLQYLVNIPLIIITFPHIWSLYCIPYTDLYLHKHFIFHWVGLSPAHLFCLTTYFSICTKYFRSVMTCLVVFGNVHNDFKWSVEFNLLGFIFVVIVVQPHFGRHQIAFGIQIMFLGKVILETDHKYFHYTAVLSWTFSL